MLLIGAVHWPNGVYPAALAYAASSLMLGLNLATAMRVYLRGRGPR